VEPTAIAITDDVVVIPLAAVPVLARDGGHVVVRAAAVIVLNLGANGFRAFSNVCTHAGCGVDRFERGRMICPCHGSEYDTGGLNVVGPAPAPLAALRVDYDPARGIVRVERR
jgi:Rieske Fe-S protein